MGVSNKFENMKKYRFSSLGDRTITPACSPGAATSFLGCFKILKILFFLKRKFCHGIFHDLTKMLLETKICDYSRIPIEIDSKPENYRYCFGISKSQKFHGRILIIFSKSLKNPFLISGIMFVCQGSKYNGKCLRRRRHLRRVQRPRQAGGAL